jgi:uncharacterized protein YndB with AHSA1/START domain
MTILLVVVIVLVVAVVAVLGLAASRPNAFRIQRSATIAAPPETIFALINDFRRWGAWSPYEKLDPTMQRTLSGAEQGRGAVYEWSGNGKAGKGRMEILESTPSSRIRIKLDFFKPFEAHNTAEFTLQPAGNATAVTWAMFGSSPFIAKVMGMVFNLDRMVGRDFETGLANLKAATER